MKEDSQRRWRKMKGRDFRPGPVTAYSMVRSRGLEPPHRFQYKHLKLARLPIPPRPHGYKKGLHWRPNFLQLNDFK
jgi:hypothetical protein